VSTDILTPTQRRAVEALGRAWGSMYDVGGTKASTYLARRDDGTGEALEAGTPGELEASLRADHVREDTP
jgi:hypothetical protein